MNTIASILDFESAARRRLPRFLYDHGADDAYDGVTPASDLRGAALRQRVLAEVSAVDTAAEL